MISIIDNFKRTYELKKAITSILKTVSPQVYYRNAISKYNYPYITYYLKHVKTEHQYDYSLEVHIWARDVKLAEDMADKIEDFDGYYYRDDRQIFDIDLESRNNLEDEDKEIQHIVLLFNLTYFTVKG